VVVLPTVLAALAALAGALALSSEGSGLLPAALTVNAAESQVTYGEPVHLSGRLSLDGRGGARKVQIRRLVTGSSPVVSQTVDTGTDGSFAATDVAPAVGSYVYAAQWVGDARFRSAAASTAAVDVRGLPVRVAMAQVGSLTAYGQSARLSVSVRPARAGTPVALWSGSSRLASAKTDAAGEAFVVLKISRMTQLLARFGGDATRQGGESSALVVRVKHVLTPRLRNWFSRSGREYLFHKSSDILFEARMTPQASSGCMHDRIEVLQKAAWVLETEGSCLPTTSFLGVRQGNGGTVGRHYRIHMEFEAGTPGDVDASPWLYFRDA
jgi:hypothetical protein